MRDGGNTCTPVGSGAVDEQFWALICEDEDWLDSEFDEIVSEPAESPRTPPPRLMLCADRSRPARQRPGPRGRDRAGHPRNTGHRPGRSWRRQRSPPRAGKHWQVTEFEMGRAVITPNESPWWRGEVARTLAPLVMRTTRLRND